MVLKVVMNTRKAEAVMVNVRTWVPKVAGRIVVGGASKLRQYTKTNIKPHNRTGKLYAGVIIAKSPKQFSAWVIVNASNERGSYARPVEEGGMNPRTGRRNRPVRYMRRAVDRYAGEHNSLVDKQVKTIPKK